MIKRLSVMLLALLMVLSLCWSAFVSFVPEVSAETAAVLVSLQTQWKYLDTGADPAGSGARTSWTTSSFNDSAWKTSSGNAKFGAVSGKLAYYSDGTTIAENLLNQYLSGTTNNVPAYFFRTTFQLSSLPSSDTPLVGTVKYDDAFILYINGTRVAAYGEPNGGYASNTSYGASVGIGAPETVEFVIDNSVLKTGTNVVAVELHQANATSSDIYFEMPSLVLGNASQTHLSMNVGSDETKRNFIWRCTIGEGSVEYAVRNGNSFPANFKSVATTTTAIDNTFVHKASIDNLAYDTEYVYRIRNGNAVSDNYYFKTDKNGDFNFIYVTDPQIGASGSADVDLENWTKAVNLANEMFPTANLMVSAGDQIDWPESPADQWGKFFAPDKLKSMALSATVGNHEAYAKQEHIYFNKPNKTINGIQYGKTAGGSNNWFTYNNVLFINLNGNSLSAAEHRVFIENAVNANPDTTWRIVIMHQSLFGGTSSYINESIINLRNALLPVLADYDIDAVLSGHDHVYARTYMLSDGFTPDKSNGVPTKLVDPEGVLYITNSTASGCKYYSLTDMANTPHIAVREQNTPTFSNVEVTANSFKVTTYRVTDKSVLDTIEIVKDKELNEERSKYKNIAKGKDYTAPEATGSYTANLTDGIAEAVPTLDDTWCGLLHGTNTNGTASVSLDFKTEKEIESFRVHLLNGGVNNSSGIRNPDKIQVFTSTDGKNYTSAGYLTLETPTANDYTMHWAELKLSKPVNAQYVRFDISHTEGWVMLNEVQVYGADKGASGTVEIGDNLAKGKKYTTSELYPSSSSASYPDEGGITMTDGILPPDDAKYDHAAYVGFNKNVQDYTDNGYFSITVDLGNIYNLAKFTAYVASEYNGAGIVAPESVWVYVSDDNAKWELVGATAPEDTTSVSAIPATVELQNAVSARYVQYRFVCKESWTMVAEVMAFEGIVKETEPPVIEPVVKKGDLNGNDEIDAVDYALQKRAYFGTFGVNLDVSDLNNNGQVDAIDYTLLKRMYFGTFTIQ